MEDSIHYSVPFLPMLCDELNYSGQFEDIGGCKLYVEIKGEGIPIVLINGGPGGTHHTFHPWFSELEKKHRVIYYDQRGTGQSDFEVGDGYSFTQAVEDLDELRKELGIEKWIVCGFSYGGGLAQYYTSAYADKVLGMVLIGPLPLFQDEGFEGNQQKFISDEEQIRRKEIIAEFRSGSLTMNSFLYNLTINGDWKRQGYYKPTNEQMIRSALYEWVNDKDFNSIMSESYSKYDFKTAFIGCPIPTFILEGKQDLTWGEKKADIFKATHPNAKHQLFEKSGHMIYKDSPGKFFKELTHFTKDLPPVSTDSISDWQNQLAEVIKTKEN